MAAWPATRLELTGWPPSSPTLVRAKNSLSTHLSIHVKSHAVTHPPIHQCKHSSIIPPNVNHPSNQVNIHHFIHQFISTSIHADIQPSVYSLFPLIRPPFFFNHPSMKHSLSHSSIYPNIHSSLIHANVHFLINKSPLFPSLIHPCHLFVNTNHPW